MHTLVQFFWRTVTPFYSFIRQQERERTWLGARAGWGKLCPDRTGFGSHGFRLPLILGGVVTWPQLVVMRLENEVQLPVRAEGKMGLADLCRIEFSI